MTKLAMADNYALEHYPQLNGTPAVNLAAHAWFELCRKGYGENTVLPRWDHEVIAAHLIGNNAGIIGIILFEDIKYMNQLWISMAYVEDGYRRRGVYSEMMKKVVSLGKMLGRSKICLGVHIDNAESMEIHRAMDYRQAAVGFELEL